MKTTHQQTPDTMDESMYRSMDTHRKDSGGGDVPESPYDLYMLLQSLKAGGINFDQFLTQATAWANQPGMTDNP